MIPMKRYWRYAALLTPALVVLAILGFQKSFPYLLREHALKTDSPYFLVACIVCGTMPLTVAALWCVHGYLSQRNASKPKGIDELLGFDAEESTLAERRGPRRRQQ